MATKTEHVGLYKPSDKEGFDIKHFNDNADLIDAAIADLFMRGRIISLDEDASLPLVGEDKAIYYIETDRVGENGKLFSSGFYYCHSSAEILNITNGQSIYFRFAEDEEFIKNLKDGKTLNSIRGSKSHVGCRGYYWSYIDLKKKCIYLSSSETNIAAPGILVADSAEDVDFTDEDFVIPTVDGVTYAVGDRFYIRNGTTHNTACTITAIEHNKISYSGETLITKIYSGIHHFCVPAKPDIGVVDLGFSGQASFGEDAVAAAENTFTAGYGGVAGANYGAVFGSGTFAGYAAFASCLRAIAAGDASFAANIDSLAQGRYSAVFNRLCKVFAESGFGCGQNNQVTEKARAGFTTGENNVTDAVASMTGGKGSKTLKDFSVAIGQGLIANAIAQAVFGRYNIEDAAEEFLLIVGNGTASQANKRSNALTVDKDGNLRVKGDIYDGKGNKMDDLSPSAEGSDIQSDWEQESKSRADFIKNKPPIKKGSGEGSIKSDSADDAIGKNGMSFGEGNISGCMGYWWEAIDTTNKIIYLSSSGTNVDTPELVTDREADTSFVVPAVDGETYAIGDRFYIRNGSQHVLEGLITGINGNAVNYDVDLGITEIKEGNHHFCVPSKPKIGLVSLFSNMASFGSENISAASNTFTGGIGNIGAGNKGAAFGDSNYVGNSAFAGGIGNLSPGTATATFGAENENYKWGCFVSGQGNIIRLVNGLVGGAMNKGDGSVAMIFGQGNKHIGDFSVLLGCNLDNIGDNNVLMGYANTTKKSNGEPTLKTTIIGNNNYGQFDNVLVLGENLVAGGKNQVVLGKWNVPNGKPFIIGCGKSGARRNALEVDENGNTKFSGTVTDGEGNVLGANQFIAKTITIPAHSDASSGTNGHWEVVTDGSELCYFVCVTLCNISELSECDLRIAPIIVPFTNDEYGKPLDYADSLANVKISRSADNTYYQLLFEIHKDDKAIADFENSWKILFWRK